MNAINNLLQFLQENWTAIVILFAAAVALGQRIRSINGKSKEEKIDAAKQQVAQVVLKLVTDAEVNYEKWNEAGSIKRSQVIQEIYARYPVLATIADQDAVVAWIDALINDSLKTLREVFEKNAIR